MGTTMEEYSPKRQYAREKIRENCIFRLSYEDTGINQAIFAETLNHSKGGLGIIYDGEMLSIGNKLSVYIENLNLFKKAAKVVWKKQLNGNWIAGLQWV